MKWWQGWLDPRDPDSWGMLLFGLLYIALVVLLMARFI